MAVKAEQQIELAILNNYLNSFRTNVLFLMSSGEQYILLPACGMLLCAVKAHIKIPGSHTVQQYLYAPWKTSDVG